MALDGTVDFQIKSVLTNAAASPSPGNITFKVTNISNPPAALAQSQSVPQNN